MRNCLLNVRTACHASCAVSGNALLDRYRVRNLFLGPSLDYDPTMRNDTDSGSVKLAYGEAPDCRMVHINDVPQGGLACGCVCSACRANLVARRGPELAAHFAHHVNRSCVAAYETMLHRMAKQIISDRMEVLLPAVDVSDRGTWRQIRREIVFRPDTVVLEQWQESIRPDIVVKRGDKELIVEIRVTHACTPEKLSLLAERQKAAIEIDLSRLPRHLDGVDLEEQVLRLAPREWLWNPYSAKVNAEIQAQHTAIQARVEAEIEDAVAAKAMSLREAAEVPHYPWDEIQSHIEMVKAAGLGGLIGHELAGDLCFAVHRMAWQGWIVFNLIKGNRAVWPASVESLHDWLASQRLIKRPFINVKTRHLSPEWTEVWERVPELRPATAVLLDYLAILRRERVIRNDRTGMMEPDTAGLAPAKAQLAAVSAGNERAKDIREMAIIVLDAVVPHQGAASFGRRSLPTTDWADGFDIDAWMGTYIQEVKATPETIARQGGSAYGQLVTRLKQLSMLGKPSISIPEGSSLGLPIINALAERAAEVVQQRLKHETAEAKRKEEVAQQEAAGRKREAEKRFTDLARRAHDALRFDGHGWLHRPHVVLEGQSVAASEGWMTDDQYTALKEDLGQQSAIRDAEWRVAEVTDHCRAILSAEVVRYFGDEQGGLWMRSAHPKLGGKRPQDICLTPDGMARCQALLKASSKKR